MESITGYTLLGMLGSGTSGTVWKAHDDTLDRMVAIKALRAPTAESRAQWRSEARVLAALDDPNLVAVYGYAETAESAYIVEEWIDGAPLPAVLTAGPLSTSQALGVIRGALLGLSHVHHRGLVHGDIAPGNILLDTQGTSKLVDFGLATHAGVASTSSGTAAYASPEAQRGAPVSAPSDVYAAAAVLAYLLRGRAAATPVLDGVDAALRPVLSRALHHDPAQRYPDAGAFLLALEQDATRRYGPAWWTQTGLAALVATAPAVVLMEGTGSTTPAVAGHGAKTGPANTALAFDAVRETSQPAQAPSDDAASYGQPPRRRVTRSGAIAGVAAVIVLASAGVVYAATQGGPDQPKPSPSRPIAVPAIPTPTTTLPPTSAPVTTPPVSLSRAPAAIADGKYRVDLVVTAVSNVSSINGAPVSAGQHVAPFVWTISKVRCASVDACTASMISSGGLHYALTWDGTRWTAKSAVGHGECETDTSQNDNFVNTVTFAPSSKGATPTVTPKRFTGTFVETISGACVPDGGSLSATITMVRG